MAYTKDLNGLTECVNDKLKSILKIEARNLSTKDIEACLGGSLNRRGNVERQAFCEVVLSSLGLGSSGASQLSNGLQTSGFFSVYLQCIYDAEVRGVEASAQGSTSQGSTSQPQASPRDVEAAGTMINLARGK